MSAKDHQYSRLCNAQMAHINNSIPPQVSNSGPKDQYSRLCTLQMTHIKNIAGTGDVVVFAKRNRPNMFSRKEREQSQVINNKNKMKRRE